jgi:hypothetical protein
MAMKITVNAAPELQTKLDYVAFDIYQSHRKVWLESRHYQSDPANCSVFPSYLREGMNIGKSQLMFCAICL